MLQNGHSVRLFLFETDDEEFHQCIDDLLAHYADQIVVVWFAGVEELVTKERDGLLVMSHLSYTKLSEDELVMRELSSLLVIRRNKNKGAKTDRLEIHRLSPSQQTNHGYRCTSDRFPRRSHVIEHRGSR